MRVVYQLEVKNEIAIEDTPLTDIKFDIEDAEIGFKINSRRLKAVKVVFRELPINFTEEGIIDPYYPEKRILAYKIFSYIANRILIQTGIECFDPQEILNADGKVFPETIEEERIWNTKRKRFVKSLNMSWSILGFVKFSDYKDKYIYADAYSNFADGIRAKNLITKYVQFYKVLETFFDKKGSDFDNEVGSYVSRFDSEFTPDRIKTLRILRNRCMHPQHGNGHISSDNIELMNELGRELKTLCNLVNLLLENPPR